MSFNYDKLWKKLIDYNMNKTDLLNAISSTPNTISRLSKNKTVNMNTLAKICDYFNCDLNDICEYIHKEDFNDSKK